MSVTSSPLKVMQEEPSKHTTHCDIIIVYNAKFTVAKFEDNCSTSLLTSVVDRTNCGKHGYSLYQLMIINCAAIRSKVRLRCMES